MQRIVAAMWSGRIEPTAMWHCGVQRRSDIGHCRTYHESFFSVLMGVDHVSCAREAMSGMIAWLRWQLGDEAERAAEFTGPDGKFHMGKWKSETKNWTF